MKKHRSIEFMAIVTISAVTLMFVLMALIKADEQRQRQELERKLNVMTSMYIEAKYRALK